MSRQLVALAGLVVVAGSCWVVARASGMPYWLAAVLVFGAIAVNGFVAAVEDDIPGGFNNPKGRNTQPYASRSVAVAKAVGATLCASVALLMALPAVQLGITSGEGARFGAWSAAAIFFGISIYIPRRSVVWTSCTLAVLPLLALAWRT